MSGRYSRQELGQAIADLCAGCRTGEVLNALLDNLGMSIIAVYDTPAEADAFLAEVPDDLRRYIRANWHDIKRQASEQGGTLQ